MVPYGDLDFDDFISSDSFNFTIYSWIIKELNLFSYNSHKGVISKPHSSHIKTRSVSKIFNYYCFLSSLFKCDIFFHSSSIKRKELNKLQLLLREIPTLDCNIPEALNNIEIDSIKRQKLKLKLELQILRDFWAKLYYYKSP